MHSQPGWRDDYCQLITRLIAEGADDAIADQLDMLVDDVADILARTHPLAPILRKWAERASAPPTTCPSTRIWLERTNA